jgi:hypothetical protein
MTPFFTPTRRSNTAVFAAVHEVRSWQCAPKARIISGGGIHPESCRLIRVQQSAMPVIGFPERGKRPGVSWLRFARV